MAASRPPAGWFELILALPAGAAEAAAAWLLDRGSSGLELRDASHPQPPADLPPDWIELRASFAADGPAPAEQLRAGLAGRLAVALGGPERAEGVFELVLANILSGTLMAMAAALLERLAPGGELVLSGVLGEEQPRVEAHFAAAGCRPLAVERDGDWCALHLAGPGQPGAAEAGR